MFLNVDSLFDDENQEWSFVALKSRFLNNPTKVSLGNDTYEIYRYPRGGWVKTDDLEVILTQKKERWCPIKKCKVLEQSFFSTSPTKEGLEFKP